jgi:hypothetical protein
VNLCRACGEDFDSIAAFDAHRVGKYEYVWTPEQEDGRRCLDTEELEQAGWRRDRWRRWRLPAGLEPKLLERVRL